jgi:hypothetical protein
VSNEKPFVQVACVCEKVLIEPDNVPSLIRIVDTYTLELPGKPLPPGVKLQTDLTAFVSLKSGDVIGDFEVGLRLNAPDGKDHPVRMWPVEFKGGEHGANLKIAFTLQDPKIGLYWFDVLWGSDVLTRIPFRLKSKALEPTGDVVAPNETVMR